MDDDFFGLDDAFFCLDGEMVDDGFIGSDGRRLLTGDSATGSSGKNSGIKPPVEIEELEVIPGT